MTRSFRQLLLVAWALQAVHAQDEEHVETRIDLPGRSCVFIKSAASGTEIGDACAFLKDDALFVNINNVKSDARDCVLKKAHFCNLPFMSTEDINEGTYRFRIPVEEMEKFVCDAGDVYAGAILGEITRECIVDGMTLAFEDSYSIPLTCNDSSDQMTSIISKSSLSQSPPPPSNKGDGENNVDTNNDSSSITETKSRNLHLHIPDAGENLLKFILRFLMSELIGDSKKGVKTICEAVGQNLFNSASVHTWERFAGDGCVMVMVEQAYGEEAPMPANRLFTVIRDPKELILSQYFRCRESRGHQLPQTGNNPTDSPSAPSLDEWLELWVKRKEGEPIPEDLDCINPINMQSRFLGDPNEEELSSRFETVGIFSKLETSACVEIITLTGKVPGSCDCSNENDQTVQLRGKSRRRLAKPAGAPLQSNGMDYGSFQPTDKQREMIATLTDKDAFLYMDGSEVFAEHVEQIEGTYGIKLC